MKVNNLLPFTLLSLTTIGVAFDGVYLIPFGIAAALFAVDLFVNRDVDDKVKTISKAQKTMFNEEVADYREHINKQQNVIHQQTELIEQLKVTVGHKTIR